MYVYKNSWPGLWTVGHYDPRGNWHSESDHDSIDKAADHVRYLNGGRSDIIRYTDPAEDAERLYRQYHKPFLAEVAKGEEKHNSARLKRFGVNMGKWHK